LGEAALHDGVNLKRRSSSLARVRHMRANAILANDTVVLDSPLISGRRMGYERGLQGMRRVLVYECRSNAELDRVCEIHNTFKLSHRK